jgi:peptide/nickel transport system ATP-binding protein/peptide/nickel transport system permease protein
VKAKARSRWIQVLRTPVGLTATSLMVALLLLAVFAPVLWGDKATAVDPAHILQGASSQHLLGTDSLGRDIFYRVLVGTRLSVELALLATALGVLAGLVLGTAPFFLGPRLGRVVTALVNIAVAFPSLLLALFLAVIFGVGMKGALLAIGFACAPTFARLTQTLVDSVVGLDYIAAARIAGVSRVRVLVRHILPNIGEPLVVTATIAAAGALLSFAGLSFLGLGVQAPAYDWGRLLGDGLNGIYIHPAAALAPGIAVMAAALAFNMFGETIAKGLGTQNVHRSVDRRAPRPAPMPVPSAALGAGDDPVLVVQDLRVSFPGAEGVPITPVRGVSFSLGRGDAVGIVGESGSGKSLTALAIAQLIEEPGRVEAESVRFLGKDLDRISARDKRLLLGTSMAMVFQDPTTSLNPTKRVGRQLAEVTEQHEGMSRKQAWSRAVNRLSDVRIPAADRRARQLPHEFSGGMRQRAMIGMGLMGNPALIVADEPTTALDVTVQRQVLQLLERIRVEDEVAILLISHDITVVGQVCSRVLVMYAGRIVEDLPAAALLTDPRHPYTRMLLAAVPDMTTDRGLPLVVIPGRPVDPAQVPQGCAFAPRCPLADERCSSEDPPLVADQQGRQVACWHSDRVPQMSVTGSDGTLPIMPVRE